MEHKDRSNFMRIRDAIAAVAAIALLYAILSLAGIGCPIKYCTGVSCPGCGMTRAWHAVLHLNFKEAFAFHPLWILPVPLALLIIFRRKINPKVFRISMIVIIAMFFVVYGIRMADPSNEVVVFRPKKGLIGRLISKITGH